MILKFFLCNNGNCYSIGNYIFIKRNVCKLQSVIEYFGIMGDNVMEVNVYLQDNKFVLFNDWMKGQFVKFKVLYFEFYVQFVVFFLYYLYIVIYFL